jgi:hypothetical protein
MARYPFPAAVASISEPDSMKFHAMLRQFDCGFTHSAVATRAAPFPIATVQPINKSSRHTNRRRRTASGPPSRHVHTGSRAHSFTIRTTAAGLDGSRAQIPLTLRRLAALTRTHHHHTLRSCIALSVVLPHDRHLKHTPPTSCSLPVSAALRSSFSTWK